MDLKFMFGLPPPFSRTLVRETIAPLGIFSLIVFALGTRTHIENNELPIVHFEPALLRAFRDSLTPRRRIEVHVRGTYLQALRDRGSYEAALSTVVSYRKGRLCTA